MTNASILGIVLVMSAVTYLSRALPFLLFGRGEEPPRWVTYLGRVLPPAIMALLIVYCLRNVNFAAGSHGFPELFCIALAAVLHLKKGNVLLSIFGATVVYMVLVQMVFG